MRCEWNVVPLRNLTGFISKGIVPSYTENETETAIRVLNQKCNRDFQISYEQSRLHDTSKKIVPAEKYIQQNDILINSTGTGTAGRVAQINDVPCKTTVDGHMIIVRANEKVTQRYLGYALKAHQQEILQLDEGSTGQTELNRERLLNEIMISFPSSVAEQEKIVALLSGLDKKIELNNKINENLERQLFLLYKNTIKSAEYVTQTALSSLCTFQEGYVNPAQTHPEYFDGDVKWLRAVDINESFIIDTSRKLTQVGFKSAKKSALLFKPNTIAISKSGTIGRLGIISNYMCGNRAVINIVPRNMEHLAFVYCYLKSRQQEFSDMAVGSVQKNLYVSVLESLIVFLPDGKSFAAFNNAGNTLLCQMRNNCIENINLSNIRNALLPRLMSGQIGVEDINI